METSKKLQRKYKKTCIVICAISGVILILVGILTAIFFRDFVNNYIKSQLILKQDSNIVKSWKKPPVKPQLKVYFFNVSNPDEFLNGRVGNQIYRVSNIEMLFLTTFYKTCRSVFYRAKGTYLPYF